MSPLYTASNRTINLHKLTDRNENTSIREGKKTKKNEPSDKETRQSQRQEKEKVSDARVLRVSLKWLISSGE